MENLDLIKYIEQARKSGMGDDKIREGLLQAGWATADVKKAMMKAPAVSASQTRPKAMMSKSLAVIFITVGVGVAVYFAGAYYMSKFQNFPLWPFEVSVPPPVGGSTFTPRPSPSGSPSTGSGQSLDFARDWQTYRNEEYGFEVKYPEGWYLINQQNDRVILSNVSIFSQLSEESLASEARFEINIEDKNVTTTIEQWFDTRFKDLDYNSKEIVALGDNKALKIEVSEIGKRIHIYAISGTTVIELVYPVQAKFQDTYNQILSTFRFTR